MAIIKMKHMSVVGLARDRDRILEKLQELGVVHLGPRDPGVQSSENSVHLKARAAQLQACLNTLDEFGHKPYELDFADHELPSVMCELLQEWKLLHEQLFATRHEIAVYTPWNDFDPEEIERLKKINVYVQLWTVPEKDYDDLEIEEGVCRKPIQWDKDVLFCTVSYNKPVALDTPALEVSMPRARLSILTDEAHKAEGRVNELQDMFCQIGSRKSVIHRALDEVRTRLAFSEGQEGSYEDPVVFGLEGWVPVPQVEVVSEALDKSPEPAHMVLRDPAEDEDPPVLAQPPFWARPAMAFFRMLGVVPGYTEYDITPIFVIAIALFTAMLIGDAGYGLLMTIPLVIFYKKLRYDKKMDPDALHMLLILGVSITIFGLMTMNIFGWTPAEGSPLFKLRILDGDNDDLMSRICFIIGAVHLTAAHLWKGLRKLRQPLPIKVLAEVGWITVLWGLYFLVLNLVLGDELKPICVPMVVAGLALIVPFTAPQKNVFKMIALGLADLPLNILACFSDTISYIRLMAVGSAGVVMERTFNELALEQNIVFAIPILVAAHSLVIALGGVAIFAHGVRLNLLEYSGHMDITWSGRDYEPFCNYTRKENAT
ncbi:V-type ATP synthase subunit I [Candidatus Hydrogenedentota bacterium]